MGPLTEEARKDSLRSGRVADAARPFPFHARAKYLTYGGPEGTAGYDEGPTRKLGPSSLEHHEDGSVTIEGEEVEDPEQYKADEPIPGAPGRDED